MFDVSPRVIRDASRSRPFLLGCLLTTAALVSTGAAADNGARSTAEGVYTADQAEQGLEVHEEYCAKCHHYSYFQGGFLISWRNQPVSGLYDLIKLKMPEDRPGALKPKEYAALLAYIFELNDLPAGDDKLSHKHDEMERILIADE
jgi:hypothetical protein